MENKTVWNRLKDLKCPFCSTMLDFGKMYSCPKRGCGFRITPRKYTELVEGIYRKRRPVSLPRDNQAGLNRL